jgi:cell division protein FtsI/penicillin-binding protein 2
VQDIYEPGSTFKVVTASAALEEHVMGVEDPIDVSAGSIRFGSRRIEDVHAYGVLSFTDVIVKSSNVGAIKIGLRLGPERLGRYVRRFGFGATLSPDFPGENPGIVWDPAKLDESALASVSMGYQVSVTPLQMATAVSAIANGGDLIEPRVVRAVVRNGRRTEVRPKRLGRAVSQATAAELTTIMEAVVQRGTATLAKIPGYTIAGKTGTAAKLVDGRYSQTEYNASFVGFLPSRDPVATIIVVIDSPHANQYYGGSVAAPIFKRIAEAALRQLGVSPTVNPAPPVLVTHRTEDPESAVARVVVMPARAAVGGTPAPQGLPDVRGLSAREALRTLGQAGVTARMTGSGFVVNQDPAAGTPIDPGASCQLWLDRLASVPSAEPSRP